MDAIACYVELIWFKALADLRAEVARFRLGVLWWVLDPVMFVTVFYLVFQVGLRGGGVDFVPFVLCGLVPWRWFAGTVPQAAGSIFNNTGVMSQAYFPKLVFPCIVVVSHTLKSFVIWSILLLFLLAYGCRPGISWSALPLVIAAQLLLILACGGLASAIVPLFPDLRKVVEHGVTMLFFLSGVFYNIDTFEDPVRSYFLLNPMAALIQCYRTILLHGSWPDCRHLAWTGIVAAFGISCAAWLLHRYDYLYPKLVA